jgi:hypothetical protein
MIMGGPVDVATETQVTALVNTESPMPLKTIRTRPIVIKRFD